MRHWIETAPKDGHFVILEDDANAAYDVGRWSAEASSWVGKDNEPVKVNPTHWHPLARDAYLQPDDEADAAPAGRPIRWRSLAALTGAVAATVLLLYYPRQESARPPVYTAREGTARQEAGSPSRNPQTVPETPRSTALEASPAAEQEQILRQQAAAPPVPDSRQSLTRTPLETSPQETAAAQELREARRTIERLESQLRAEATAEQEALKQERERLAALAEAAAARQELATSRQQHGQALDEVQGRNVALAQELATAKRGIETQAEQLRRANGETALSKQAEATATGQLLEQQHQREAALADAAAARQDLTTSTAQHRQALDDQKNRNAALASELATARREIETQAAQLRRASDEAAQPSPAQRATAERQRESTAAALAEAKAARQELAASTQQHGRALDEVRARNAALAQELATVRRAAETQTEQLRQANSEIALSKQGDAARTGQLLEQQRQREAALAEAAAARQDLTTSTAQHRQALDDEKNRNAALASELATAQQINEKLVTQLRLVAEQTELRRRADDANKATLEQALKDERDRAVALAAERDEARRAAAVAQPGPGATAGEPASRDAAPAAGTATTPPATSDQQDGLEAARMIARAGMLLGQGDIGAARIVLERAAELGSARAVFMLAETYDPGILSTWKTYGTQGEVTRARALYEKAHGDGIREAKERLDALGR